MPVSGVMPMGIGLPARPSRVRWLPEVFFMLVVVCLLLLHGVRPASLVISSRYLWSSLLPLLAIQHAAMEVGEPVANESKRGTSEAILVPLLLERADLHLQVCSHHGDGERLEGGWRSEMGRLQLSKSSSMLEVGRWRLLCSSCREDGGRWPTCSSSSTTFRVEGRPYFPPGRRAVWEAGSVSARWPWLAAQPWRPHRTKWCVPGAGEEQAEWNLLRTRSRFSISVRGPFCKSQGLGGSFLFSVEPLCKMFCYSGLII